MIKNLIVSCCILCLSTSVTFGQSSTLTSKQKVSDFNYFCQIVKENYPFLHANKRLHGIDWLANKKNYLKELSQTKTDSAYISMFKHIIANLHDGHLSLNPTLWPSDYLKAYRKVTTGGKDNLQPWVDILAEKESKALYWARILEKEQSMQESSEEEKPKENVTCRIVDNNIAIIQIGTFSTFMIKRDSAIIANFFSTIGNCRYLIIDIQENSGGDGVYWVDNIVKPLSKQPINYSVYGVMKDGELNRTFYADFIQESKQLTEKDAQKNMPSELFLENYYIQKFENTLYPSKQPIDFNGQIFVATSKTVFSASEAFAEFCKFTGWATLIGEQTGGDGIGGCDPIIVALPESGILITLPVQTGLNPDGSFNAETKTQPDIEIKATNSTERMERIVEYVRRLN